LIGSHQLTVSEAMGLHEVLLETATSIEKLAFFADSTNDRELEGMFRSHARSAERTYQELLGFTRDEGTRPGYTTQTGGTQFYGAQGGQQASRQTVRPEPTGRRLQDHTMVMDSLVDCKSASVTCMTVATECSSPTLRRTLADISRQHLDSAYELYKIAEQHGWYPSLQPHESPEDWLRSTHLPPAQYVASGSNHAFTAQDGRGVYATGTAGIQEAYRGHAAAPAESAYGRAPAGATYGYQASGAPSTDRTLGETTTGPRYGAPNLDTTRSHRH